MQEFKQETIWGSFIALDLHKVKIIHHNCFLWPSGSKTRLFTWMAACSGETDANPELRNLLIRLYIPVLQITWHPYQEGSWGTQFKNPGLRPKVARVRHNCPAHKPAPNTVLGKLQVAGTSHSISPLKAFSLVYFQGWVLQLCCTSESAFLPIPEGWWGLHTPPAGRQSPYRLPSLQEPHLNSELGEGLRGKIWQACIGLQRFSIKETENTNTHASKLSPIFLKLICSSGSEGQLQLQPQHEQMPVTNCKDSQAQSTVIIFRVHI